MKVEKIKKTPSGKYEVLLSDGNVLILFEDVIISNNLLGNKIIDESLLKKINIDNEYASSYNLALKYISIRLRSTKEVIDYLNKKMIDKTIVNETITKLKKNGYLNDDRFIKAFINDKILMTNWGPYKIARELEKYGVFYHDDINNIIDKNTLKDRVKTIIKKMVSSNKSNSINMLKNKILNNLISIGYTKESVLEDIENIKIANEQDRYNKEYNKLYNKYKNKYKDEQLERIIKNKLYQRGFNPNNYN
jgi:regulatory protein